MKIEITEDMFAQSLNVIAANKDGQVVLACLKDYVNFNGDILSAKDLEGTYANAILRRAYLYLRNRIHEDSLKEIEFNYIRKANNDERKPRATKPSERAARSTSVISKPRAK